jgi:hypothetical protein
VNISGFNKNVHKHKKLARSWSDIVKFKEELDGLGNNIEWIFRGQSNNKELRTLLERAIRDLKLKREDAFDIEFALTDRFKRNLHTIDPAFPKNLSSVELFAVMQHYGTPTRLLDFTYSFYVAVFFALENFQGKSPTLWSIDSLWLQDQAINCLGVSENEFMPGKFDEDFQKYFMKTNNKSVKRIVYQITPNLLNIRLSIQQGTFLCPSNINTSFMVNLVTTISESTSIEDHIKILEIDTKARNQVLKELYRMNISRSSLFPGLTGFAESLKQSLIFPATITIYRKKRMALLNRKKSTKENHDH